MRLPLLIAMTTLVVGSAVQAKPAPQAGTPQSVDRMLACRQLADPAARLACFDREVGGLAQRLVSKDLVVIDKERARVAGRSVFGFSVPNFSGLFGSSNEVKSIEATIRSVAQNRDGGWTMRLDDGSLWTQTDGLMLGVPPRVGNKVAVRRGALGSFILVVDRQPGIKVKRIG